MKVVCAWCGLKIGDVFPFSDKRTSHGMCPACLVKFEKELEEYKQKRINEQIEEAGG